MSTSPLSLKKIIIIVVILLAVIIGGYLAWQGFEGEFEATIPKDLGPLGELGSKCSGPGRFPCNIGLTCDLEGGQRGVDYGTCVKNETEAAEVVNEGDTCDQVTRACGPGLKCEKPEGEDEGVCVQMIPSSRPFIMSVVPEGMELISGAYKADPGTEITVRVRAVNVEGGELYLKPLWASHSGVMPEEKVSALERQGESNEYIGTFTVDEELGASLIAIMSDEDGQDAQVSINVAATFE
jgi:hypothetical protein